MLHKILRLTRPLCVFDLETTGIDTTRDRIIQLGMTMYYPDKDPIAYYTLVNPGVPIKNSGTSHKITDEMVVDAPKFRDLAPSIAKQIVNVDLGGHNSSKFDFSILKSEMQRAEVLWNWEGYMVDTLSICRLKNPHTLANAVMQFVDKEIAEMFDLPMDGENFHDAGYDVKASSALLYGQLLRYPDLPRTVKELAEFCSAKVANSVDKKGKLVWIDEVACMNFGKWRGTPLAQVDRSYITWLINNTEMEDDTIVIFGNALKKIYPTK